MKKILLFVLLITSQVLPAQQDFIEQAVDGIPGLFNGDVSVDGTSLFVTGISNFDLVEETNASEAAVYDYLGDGNFSRNTEFSFPEISMGFNLSADIDNAHPAIDRVLVGANELNPSDLLGFIYLSSDSGYSEIPIVGLFNASGVLADFDGDGDLDLKYQGSLPDGTRRRIVYRNNSGSFEKVIDTEDLALNSGDIELIDYNNDGKIDVVINGGSGSGRFNYLLQNTSTASVISFQNESSFNGIGVNGSSMLVNDLNSDSHQDIIISGGLGGPNSVFSVLYGTGTSSFNRVDLAVSDFLNATSMALSDFDNDGDMDVYASGLTSSGDVVRLYENVNGSLVLHTFFNPGVIDGFFAIADFNADSKEDMMYFGNTTNFPALPTVKMYINNFGDCTETPWYADVDGDGFGSGAAEMFCPGDQPDSYVENNSDAFPDDPNEWVDTDTDGVGDNSDAFPNDPNESVDTDFDGIGDNADTDDDGDTYSDDVETGCAGTDPLDIDSVPLDTDVDGDPDCSDSDDDNDGVSDAEDAFPNDPNESVDTDFDGIGDNADTDDDGDTYSDDVETGCAGTDPLDEDDIPNDADNNGIPDCSDSGDSDNDGVSDMDEVLNNTDPANNPGDTDGDTVNDDLEVDQGSDSNNPCDQNLSEDAIAGEDYNPDNEIWQSADCDEDGVTNGQEVVDVTNPYDSEEFLNVNSFELDTSIALYPNPSAAMVFLEISPEIEVSEFLIFNLLGQEIATFKEKSFDVSSLTRGYYLVVFEVNKVSKTLPLIVN